MGCWVLRAFRRKTQHPIFTFPCTSIPPKEIMQLLTRKARPTTWLALLIATLMATSSILLLPGTVHAAEGDELSWSVKPGGDLAASNFSYELAAGATQQGTFTITNLGAKAIKLAVYAADGTTSSTGALDLLPAAEASNHLGLWVKVETPEVELFPGAKAEVPFTLTVPVDAEPGDYVGGLVSSYVDSAQGGTVQVDRRLATRMNLKVAGEGTVSLVPSELSVTSGIAWNPFAPISAEAIFIINNDGNVRARGNYNVTTAGPFGWGKRSVKVPLAELIPGGSATTSASIDGIWALGWLTTTVDVSPEGIDATLGETTTTSLGTWAMPWGQLALLVLVVLIAVMVGLRRGRVSSPELTKAP